MSFTWFSPVMASCKTPEPCHKQETDIDHPHIPDAATVTALLCARVPSGIFIVHHPCMGSPLGPEQQISGPTPKMSPTLTATPQTPQASSCSLRTLPGIGGPWPRARNFSEWSGPISPMC